MNNYLKTLIVVFLFFIVFVISFPKDRVYYFGLTKLAKYNIEVFSLDKEINPFGIFLDKNRIYLSKAQVAKVGSIDIGLTNLSAKDIALEGSFKSFLPKVKSLKLWYTLGKFCEITGDFGKVVGESDLLNKKIVFKAFIDQNNYNKYRNVFGRFKKVKEGYRYEFNF